MGTRAICEENNCNKKVKKRVYCIGHYRENLEKGTFPKPINGLEVCIIENCLETYRGKNYCHRHLFSFQKYGDPLINIQKIREKDIEEQMKTCTVCNERKSFDQYWRAKNGNGGRFAVCITCASEEKAKSFKKVMKNMPGFLSSKNHNLPYEKYLSILSNQDYKCPICKKDFGEANRICIDHDHGHCPKANSCGICIRGIICNRCNSGLGHFFDDSIILENALEYLKNYQSSS